MRFWASAGTLLGAARHGDVDGQLPHTGTEAWTSGLGLAKVRSWRPWLGGASNSVQGYSVQYAHNFTYCTVKGAGHMVPTFMPAASLQMFERFLAGKPY